MTDPRLAHLPLVAYACADPVPPPFRARMRRLFPRVTAPPPPRPVTVATTADPTPREAD